MNRNHFRIGDRVRARRELYPIRDGIMIRYGAAGYITALYRNVAFVKFGRLDQPVAVRYGDLEHAFRHGDRVVVSALRCTAWDGRIAWFSI